MNTQEVFAVIGVLLVVGVGFAAFVFITSEMSNIPAIKENNTLGFGSFSYNYTADTLTAGLKHDWVNWPECSNNTTATGGGTTGYVISGNTENFYRTFLYFDTSNLSDAPTHIITNVELDIWVETLGGAAKLVVANATNGTYPGASVGNSDWNKLLYDKIFKTNQTIVGGNTWNNFSLDYNDINEDGMTVFTCFNHYDYYNMGIPGVKQDIRFDDETEPHPPNLVVTMEYDNTLSDTLKTSEIIYTFLFFIVMLSALLLIVGVIMRYK